MHREDLNSLHAIITHARVCPYAELISTHVAQKMALSFEVLADVIGAELAGSDGLATKKKDVTASQESYRPYLVVDSTRFVEECR